MKTIRLKIYKFEELSKDAQQKAVSALSDINVAYYEWWDSTYEDAANIGLKITSFELDNNRHAKGELKVSLNEACNRIIANHGDQCETYKTATAYQKQWSDLVAKFSDGKDLERVTEGKESEFDIWANDLETEFLMSLLKDYSIILQNECDYLQSDSAIIETIESNEYDFLEDGTLYNHKN